MFDFAFTELIVILLVALVVIGPERLPKVARTAGHLWGRVQRYVHSVKNDIANDIAIEEVNQLRGTIRNEVSAIEKASNEARLALEQKILDAQTGKSSATPDEQKPSVTQPSTTPGKPV
ncbi:MAG: twin arginine-targeting protein translocase TatB [Gallionellales bacterium RIFCSPLOWO2_12_FULL_59_22]|nr:MAG: twin arginine-targeting protein translocase TatB [Gallionellales bacterium RIFCSPLOWO2_02_FULL_59_110]OGT02914.1 MAG: twin arginine-targeting protein translocase TatB [Gallionellales bacterium RIFCSPLOWO2_02_58_13]OGT13084.1 MAG: twin arginine-targeting protein translocase TatB [Gallionellales bacterium RIFCSPLOWO2_12_FULL_59_22]